MATITEDYVSFETAKLLKEKGFNEGCSFVVNAISKGMMPVSWPTTNSDIEDEKASFITLPTLQMTMKWLREEHKIHIQIWILEEKGYWFDIEKILNARYKHKSLYSTGLEDIYFESYEQAADAAIKYCLENLI